MTSTTAGAGGVAEGWGPAAAGLQGVGHIGSQGVEVGCGDELALHHLQRAAGLRYGRVGLPLAVQQVHPHRRRQFHLSPVAPVSFAAGKAGPLSTEILKSLAPILQASSGYFWRRLHAIRNAPEDGLRTEKAAQVAILIVLAGMPLCCAPQFDRLR